MPGAQPTRWLDPARRKRRFLIYFLYFLILFWYLRHRIFIPQQVIHTGHFVIESCATPELTRKSADALESLYRSYTRFFRPHLLLANDPGPLRLRIYRDRDHFRNGSPLWHPWAEGYYLFGVGHGYCEPGAENPASWLTHEATHQLNKRLARLTLPRWLEEGIAVYFSASRIHSGEVRLGDPDPDAYPAWHLLFGGWNGDQSLETRLHRLIPLRQIVSGEGGPDINRYFNTYYVHWWSLVHFMLHGQYGKYRDGFFRLILAEGSPDAFERYIGPFAAIQDEWYDYIRIPLLHRISANREKKYK